MKKLIQLFSVILCLGLVGCASTGNKHLAKMDKHTLSAQIHDHHTTKSDLAHMFGDPQEVDFDHIGREKWIYHFTKSSIKATNFIPVFNWFKHGTDDFHKRLVVVFDEDGRVLRHAYSESQGETVTGLAG